MAFSAFERFTIVDIDGELLTNPGDELAINEPIGFSDLISNLKADEEYFGFNAEFGEAESELGFDWNKATGAAYSGQEFITWFVDNIGIDANISLRYYRTSGGTETLDYEWALILKSTDEIDAPIRVRVKKEDFGDKLRTRFDTDVDVESNSDLDDNFNVPLTLIEIPLFSKGIRFDVDIESENEDVVSLTTGPFAGTTRIGMVPYSITNLLEIKGFLAQTGWSSASVDTQIPEEFGSSVNPDFFMMEVVDSGLYNFDISIPGYDLSLDADVSANYFWSINLIFKIFDQDNNLISYNILDTGTSGTGNFVPIPINYSGSGSYNASHQLEEGYKVYFYYRVRMDRSGSSPTEVYWNFSVDDGSYFKADVLSYKNPSTTTGHFITDVLNKSVEKAIGAQGDPTITLTNITGTFQVSEEIYTQIIISLTLPSGTFQVGEVITSGTFSGTVISYSLFFGNGFITIKPISGYIEKGKLLTGQTSGATGYSFSNVSQWFIATVNSFSSPTMGITITAGNVYDGAFFAGETSGATATIDSISFPQIIDLADDSDLRFAKLNFITTGKKIRGLTENSNLKVKPSQLFDFLRCRWAAGWQIVNNSGTKTIKVDKNWEFLQPVKILTLYNVENPVRRQFNIENIYNESEVGYSKFAKENEDGSIDGFNTKQNRLHPVEKEKKKLSLIAPVVTDGAEIERVRRLKIKEDESDQSDDEIIVIKCIEINATTPLNSEDYGNFSSSNYAVVGSASNDTFTFNDLYLKGQIEDATTLFLRRTGITGFSFISYPITNITFNTENNQTLIQTSTNLTNTNATSYSLYFDKDIYLPEKLTSFYSVSGVDDIYSTYNIDQAPSNFLLNWWHILGGAVTQKSGAKKVKFTSGQNTVSLSKRYRSSSAGLTTSQITEGQDFLLSSLNGYNPPIITPFAWELTCYLTYDDWQLVRRALLGENTDSPSKNWGYLEFTDNFGNLVQIWPRTLKRTEKSGKVEIFGWQRNTSTPPPPPTFYMLQENGDRIKQENDDFILNEG